MQYKVGFRAIKYFIPGVSRKSRMKKRTKRGRETIVPYVINEKNVSECGSMIVCLSHIVNRVISTKIM